MDVKLITKDTEQKLVASLRSAISDVNGGADPNQALAKQALDNGFGPDLACRLVEAFNTSKTLNRLRNSEGEKRAESFTLANSDIVLAKMYSPADTSEKSAGVVQYNDPRKYNFNALVTKHAAHEKSAAVLSVGTEHTKKALFGIRGNTIVAGRSFLNSIGHARDDYRMHIKRAKEDVAHSLHAFVSSFKKADRSAMSPLKDVEERLSYHFGPVAKQAMDLAWGLMTEKQRSTEKRAEAVPTSYVHPLTDELYKLGEDLVTKITNAADLQAEFVAFDKKASLVEAHLKHQVDLIAGVASARNEYTTRSVLNEEEVSPILAKSAADFAPHEQNAPTESPAAGGGAGGLSKLLTIPDAKPVVPKSLFPAQHEGNLRAIRTQLMLNDMISNDPVISGYPVDDVMTTYNQIAEMLPALSTQPIAMRGLISSMLQRGGGLEAMEVKNLLDTEERKRKLRVVGS